MDADCLIKLTKSNLKEIVCRNFSVTIPLAVKEEVIDNAQGHPDAAAIKDNLENKILAVQKQSVPSQKGEDAISAIYRHRKYDAVGSDDKKFINRLQLLNIPYMTPSIFVVVLLQDGKLNIKEAREKLERLSPFISDEEYNAVKLILQNWRMS
jgi:rRNA-processing protein FCF1